MIYLASASPRRAKLLKKAGIRFKVVKVDYHERDRSGEAPSQLVQKHALGKALAAARTTRDADILAADTVVYRQGRIFGKPADLRAAVRTLSLLQGQRHTVYTGVAFLKVRRGRLQQKKLFYEKTEVTLKKMDKKAIRNYFKRINPLDKAGAYAIQSERMAPRRTGCGIVQEVRGSFSNAVGLPMERLRFL